MRVRGAQLGPQQDILPVTLELGAKSSALVCLLIFGPRSTATTRFILDGTTDTLEVDGSTGLPGETYSVYSVGQWRDDTITNTSPYPASQVRQDATHYTRPSRLCAIYDVRVVVWWFTPTARRPTFSCLGCHHFLHMPLSEMSGSRDVSGGGRAAGQTAVILLPTYLTSHCHPTKCYC